MIKTFIADLLILTGLGLIAITVLFLLAKYAEWLGKVVGL